MKITEPLLVRVLFEYSKILIRIVVNKALPIFQWYVVQLAVGYRYGHDGLVAIGAVFLAFTAHTIAI